MSRILLMFSLVVSTLALIHIRGLALRAVQAPTPYLLARTQYLLPCNVCTNALLNSMESPSSFAFEFEKKVPLACATATHHKNEQDACVSLLTKYSRTFVRDQNMGRPVQESCVATYATNCPKNNAVVLCDKRKKRGYCHVISVD
jgi:hypothetical protein